MALSNYYGVTAGAADEATKREQARLKAVAEQNANAANVVQQQLMQQRLLNQTGAGVRPRSTLPAANPAMPDVQTVGGTVTDRSIVSPPAYISGAGIGGERISSMTPSQAGLKPPAAVAATPATPAAAGAGALTPEQVGPIANNIAFGRGWLPQPNQLPIQEVNPEWSQFQQNVQAGRNLYRMDKRLAVLGSDVRGYPEIAGAWNYFTGTPQQGEVIDYRAKAGSWLMSNEALDIVKANPALLDEAERDPIGFYQKYGPESGAAATTGEPTATTTQPAATATETVTPTTSAGVTPTTAGTEVAAETQTVGLEPPPPEPEPGVPEVLTNPRLRAAIPDAQLDYQAQRLAADRQDLLNFYNRQAEQIRASAAAADQRRNAQYENLMVQAREAAVAGNTGYAQTLMNQADALLAEAETSAATVQQSMDDLWVNARETMATNEASILSNQAVIAEREFSQFNNPSRALAMMEAYGFQGAELEDAGNGKFRMRMPSNEPGQFFYVQDDNGKPATFTKQSFVEYFMGTISEDFRLKAQEGRSAAAADARKFQQELDKELFKSALEVDKYLKTEGLKSDKYETKLDETTGTVTYTPKNPLEGLPIIRVAPSLAADGQTTVYKPQVIDVTGLLNR